LNRTKHIVEALRIRDVNCDLLLIKLLGEGFELRRSRNQNDLRLQSDDALDARVHGVADLRDLLSFGRVIAVFRVAHQLIAGADRVNNLGQIRRERNDAINFERKAHAAPSFIGNLARFSCRLRIAWMRAGRR